MERKINSTLAQHFCAALAWLLATAIAALAQTTEANLKDRFGKISPAVKHPITITTLAEKEFSTASLAEWRTTLFSDSQAGESQQIEVEGYPALIFSADLEGEMQRWLAVDLGDGKVLLHRTTDYQVSDDNLIEDIKPFIGAALAHIQSSAAQGAQCPWPSCVLWARTQVPSLPTGLETYTGKLAIINHQFPRVGSVAVHLIRDKKGNNNGVGHVSVIRNVTINNDGSLRLSIQEANYIERVA
jgi:hypothetical protein